MDQWWQGLQVIGSTLSKRSPILSGNGSLPPHLKMAVYLFRSNIGQQVVNLKLPLLAQLHAHTCAYVLSFFTLMMFEGLFFPSYLNYAALCPLTIQTTRWLIWPFCLIYLDLQLTENYTYILQHMQSGSNPSLFGTYSLVIEGHSQDGCFVLFIYVLCLCTLQKRIERGWANRGGELSFRGDDDVRGE